MYDKGRKGEHQAREASRMGYELKKAGIGKKKERWDDHWTYPLSFQKRIKNKIGIWQLVLGNRMSLLDTTGIWHAGFAHVGDVDIIARSVS